MLSDTDVEKRGVNVEGARLVRRAKQPLGKLRKGLEKAWRE
jgi:hypothetical protein